ncbi:MAG: C25 family cysteine peptidase [Myxococcota bacterium]|nr:C25 family cysteine peptidase [Myxococcota bacterium]
MRTPAAPLLPASRSTSRTRPRVWPAPLLLAPLLLTSLILAPPALAAPGGLLLGPAGPRPVVSGEVPAVHLEIRPTATGRLVHFTLPGLVVDEVPTAQQGTFVRLSLPGEGIGGSLSQPELPVIRRSLDLPRGSTAQVELVRARTETHTLPGLGLVAPLFPRQRPQPKTTGPRLPPLLVLDPESYAQDRFTADPLVELVPLGVVAGRERVQVVIRPVQYNPARRELRILTSGTVRLTVLPPASTPEPTSAEVHDSLGGYLIVAAADLVDSPALAELVRWKTEKGYATTLVSTAQTGTTRDAILAYVQQAYDGWTPPPVFLLLVGDTNTIPHHVGRGSDRPATDLVYSNLEGDDLLADLGVGRLPARNGAQLERMVNKILDHELHAAQTGWESRISFMAGKDNNDITEGTHEYVIDEVLAGRGFTVDRFYAVSRRADEDDLLAALQEGETLACYSGHGDVNGWVDGIDLYNSDLARLDNEVRPVVLSFACLTGAYEESECFGEAWLRAQGGGVAFLGSSVNSMWEEDDVLERKLFRAVFPTTGPGQTWLAGLMNGAKAGYLDHYGTGGDTRRYFEMYNLLGDPDLDLWTAAPTPIALEVQPLLLLGIDRLQVHTGVPGDRIGLSRDGVHVASGRTGPEGSLELRLPPAAVAEPGRLLVVATGHDRLPTWADIEVVSSGDGLIFFSREQASPSSPATVVLGDSDLAGSGTATVSAWVAASVEEEPEATESAPPAGAVALELVLVEEPGGLGLFRSMLPVGCHPAEQAPGVLPVAHGDRVLVRYLDADDGQGQQQVPKLASLTIDCQAPAFGGIAAVRAGRGRVELTWKQADDPSQPLSYQVYRATAADAAPGELLASTGRTRYVDETVENGRWYYYVVRATDGLGNQDDNTLAGRGRPAERTPAMAFDLAHDPGWRVQGQWAFGQPEGQGGERGAPDPTQGATGENVYGYNLAGDYDNGLRSTSYLTTLPLDCSSLGDVELVFQRWLGVESADDATIQVSNNGKQWHEVWANGSSSLADASWREVRYDISEIASHQPTVYVRWGLGPTNRTQRRCGWNIDDVALWAVVHPDAAGRLLLDRPAYGTGVRPQIALHDRGANRDPAVREDVQVTASTLGEPDGQPLVLRETGPDTGVFTGELELVAGPPAADGQLQVAHGEPLAVDYDDPDAGDGVPRRIRAEAIIDLVPPVVRDLRVEEQSDRRASVSFTSDEPTRVRVLLTDEAGRTGREFGLDEPASEHTLVLGDLAPSTTYGVRVLAEDVAGNQVQAPEDGTRLLFTTTAPAVGPAGVLYFDRLVYEVPATLRLVLADSGLDLGRDTPDRLTVQVRSATEPDGESLELVEEEPGVLRGSLPLVFGPAAADDGQLQVAEAWEPVTASYLDEDDGNGVAMERKAYSRAILVDDLTTLRLEPLPSQVVAGEPVPVLLEGFDRYGRPTPDGRPATVLLTATTGRVLPSPVGPFVQGRWQGEVVFTAAGEQRLTATSGEVSVQSQPLEVVAGEAASLEITPLGPQVAGVPFQVEVRAHDRHGNLAAAQGELELTDLTFQLTPRQVPLVDGRFVGEVTIAEGKVGDLVSARLGGLTARSNPFDVRPTDDEPGCSCRLPAPTGAAPSSWPPALLLASLGLLGLRRRR